ncbi:leucine-rich repeat protein 1-like [Linepithema humile]|uniref:leucine-rich repeat protein 1-like n=1 Tax=Linepithema humile TaxID=83485 RepID=UPI000623042C|nr:PREDICTED: leucine-rich repeat protein 1-like [Linepithema humile]
MKLHCYIAFCDRTLSYNKSRQKSILTFAKKSAECPDPYLYWQIIGKSQVEKYEIIDNIERMFHKYVNAGKATIQFKQPCHNLIIQSEDILQLRMFLNILYQTRNEGKITIKNIPIFNPTVNVKSLKQKFQATKVVIKKISEYPVLQGFPKTTQQLFITGLNRRSFDRQILQLQSLRVLDLSKNSLIFLPKELGTLPNLQNLNLSHNCLGLNQSCPVSKWEWLEQSAIKSKLTNLEINHNQLKELPVQVGKLKALIRLSVCNNLLTELPQNIGNLKNLNFLFLSNNKLTFLPGTIKYLKLQFLNITENLFAECKNEINNNIQWLTLEELAAKVILQFRLQYNVRLPNILSKNLDEAKYCYTCGNACFGSYIRKVNSFSPAMIALEYQWAEKHAKLECYFCSTKCFYGKM